MGHRTSESLRRRYHQPKGVEQFGIEPVPVTQDGPLVRYLFDHLRICPRSRFDAGRRSGGGFGIVVSPRCRGHHLGRAAGDHRLHDHGDSRRRFRPAGPGLDPHGLWRARRRMGPVIPANDRLDLFVCLSNRCGLTHRRCHSRPLDRDTAFADHGRVVSRFCRRWSRSSDTVRRASLTDGVAVQDRDPQHDPRFAGDA